MAKENIDIVNSNPLVDTIDVKTNAYVKLKGTVSRINIIYTTLKMVDGRLVQIPNGTLLLILRLKCMYILHLISNIIAIGQA